MTSAPPAPSTPRVVLIDQLAAEWQSLGRCRAAVRALESVAQRDPGLARLVHGTKTVAPTCPTPFDLVEHLRRARGRTQREEAARLVRVLLREAGSDPFIGRLLVQALVPGLVTMAKRLRWGKGGDWRDATEFFGDVLTTTWLVVEEWSGQDRPYAVLDLLSAIRCRLRRQLFRAKDQGSHTTPLRPEHEEARSSPSETDLETLTRLLIELRRDGMRADEVRVLYAQHVLGFSIAELAAVTGRDRRVLYGRRDRGRRRLCA
jgi:DNA-directed RNA polymerase specialized sigma24 family protein